jgi:ribonucleotide monophosphatase NagD (HAD superfamily)
MGKPENYLCDIFFGEEIKRESKRFLMIGDRLNTDILFGKKNNFQTLLVESGVHKMDKVEEILSELENGASDPDLENQIPDFYLSSLGDLFKNYEE